MKNKQKNTIWIHKVRIIKGRENQGAWKIISRKARYTLTITHRYRKRYTNLHKRIRKERAKQGERNKDGAQEVNNNWYKMRMEGSKSRSGKNGNNTSKKLLIQQTGVDNNNNTQQ